MRLFYQKNIQSVKHLTMTKDQKVQKIIQKVDFLRISLIKHNIYRIIIIDNVDFLRKIIKKITSRKIKVRKR